MAMVVVECFAVGEEVVIYMPGTTNVAITCPTIEAALAHARAEWPANGIRVITSVDIPRVTPGTVLSD